MASSDDILIVMALEKESGGLFEKAGFQPLYTQIGKLNAALTLTTALQTAKPKLILNLGTAGCHKIKSGAYKLHDLVECTSFVQRDLQQFYRKSERLEIAAHTDLPKACCGTGDLIEMHNPQVECDVMDMEAYALAAVSKKNGVPFVCVKYISDASDENLVQDWKAHLNRASTALFKFHQDFIQKI